MLNFAARFKIKQTLQPSKELGLASNYLGNVTVFASILYILYEN